MLVSEAHFSKAQHSIVLTLFGIFMSVSDLHPENVQHLIVVILFRILILLSELHSAYLQPIITQYFIDNKSEIWLLFLIAHSKR